MVNKMDSKTSESLIFSSRGNGKLLLSGEYLVLKGARALSVPLKLGQSLDIYQNNQAGFSWEARHAQGIWNTVSFDNNLNIIDASDADFGEQLKNILSTALEICPLDTSHLIGKKALTQMGFMPEWGLGSSSTLIYNVAAFFNINPYLLLKATFGGSGYDIANAGSAKPIFFWLDDGQPQITEANFSPSFHQKIYFVYANKKQSSKSSIKGFVDKIIDANQIKRISAISDKMVACTQLVEFQELMKAHEDIIGDILGETPVQQKHFSDFDGCIKSLGAWGGDFMMVTTHRPKSYVLDYFGRKNMGIIYRYNDLVLNGRG